jgi:hypothetical protein
MYPENKGDSILELKNQKEDYNKASKRYFLFLKKNFYY